MNEKTSTAAPILMSPREVSEHTSISKSYLPKMAARGEFPHPIKITERRIAFVRSEVMAWLESRVASRTGATA
ncbi:helix-turn-helix transcriptional regulator [Agrobacterium fabrum]|uniref:helix-turn-helix transcriptional regulator n=1 Tax=Agrobacterium fabrum TaxID=1176649 RepID=UPI0021581557|nr:AlpA family phage regulatory protein [Agrobacterium fabrum]MCR6722797.1 AlpA family phage regulatory protein [Agrobacterium fabrum]